MAYTYADYVRDHGKAPQRHTPHDWEPNQVRWTRPLMRYWEKHTYDGKPVRLQNGQIKSPGNYDWGNRRNRYDNVQK